MKFTQSFISLFCLSLPISVLAQATTVGNCVSGNYTFAQNRIFPVPIGQNASLLNIDPDMYDFSIDYGSPNAEFNPATNSITLKITKGTGVQGEGVRMSTVRYLHYAKITASLVAAARPGAVTAFITMSPVHDEIDFETVGKDPNGVQTNIFYRGIPEYQKHSGGHDLSRSIALENTYTIDWNRQRIQFSVNDQVVRTVTHAESFQETVSVPEVQPFNDYWYPSTPSHVQFAVWDGGNSPNAGTAEWAGGPTDLSQPITAQFNWLAIQCYDDKDQPVPEWPVGSKGVQKNATVAPITAPVTGGPAPTGSSRQPTSPVAPLLLNPTGVANENGKQVQSSATHLKSQLVILVAGLIASLSAY